MKALVGGVATGVVALCGLLIAGYLLSDGESFKAVTAVAGIALTAGILAWYEFRAFTKHN